MPILAQEVRRPVAPVVRAEDWRRLEFRALDGSDLIQWTGLEWILQRGVLGLDLPSLDVITEQVQGMDGARLLEIRTLPRNVFVPVMLNSLDGSNVTLRAQLDRLRGMLDYRTVDYVAAEGVFDLAAITPNSERTLRCVYLEGAEGEYTLDSVGGRHWQKYGVRLLAVDPYWRGQQWSTPVVSLPVTSPFLSNDAADGFGELAITASVAFGADMPVVVGGRIPSPATIVLTGPATTTHITSPQGLDVEIGAVAAGHTVLVDTGRVKRCELDGAPAPDLITSESPQWRALPPGKASVTIAVTGATTATNARVYGTELWDTSW